MNSLKVIERVIEVYQALVHEITDVTTGSSEVINKYKLKIDYLMQEAEIPFIVVPSEFDAYPKFLDLVVKDMNKNDPKVEMEFHRVGILAGDMALALHNLQKSKGTTERTYLEEVAFNKAGAFTRSSFMQDVYTTFGKVFSYNDGKLVDDEVFIYMQDLDNLRVAVIRWLGIFNFLNTDLWWVRDND